jgi:AbrB family looped-hinge helix DNA binding protein
MPIATLTSKGQTTIPKAIRERLALKPGDRIEFVALPDGSVRLVPANVPLKALKGLLGKSARGLAGDRLDHAIRDGWGSRWRRFDRRSK